jgi:hypothetical protein
MHVLNLIRVFELERMKASDTQKMNTEKNLLTNANKGRFLELNFRIVET